MIFKPSVTSAVMRVIKARLAQAQKDFEVALKDLTVNYKFSVKREKEAHKETLQGLKSNFNLDQTDLFNKHVNSVLEKVI